MKRVFIAIKIDPDKNCRKFISTLRSELADESIKWTSEENLHVTLSFLGNVEENTIPGLKNMLTTISSDYREFELIITGLGVFKSLNDPKIIQAGIYHSETLNALQLRIEQALVEEGFETDKKQFVPHLTLGRVKLMKNVRKLKTLLLKCHSYEIQKIIIRNVILFESVLTQKGPVYTPLSKHDLMHLL
ncbi:MAG TPA: RNA 2',3'-cyclic phosphodiesterase [Bacteroidales bacterium]|nr:RNA 2',3'-cyclic phosphodiesterase [Bacteroidales bacterium]